jgi:nucleoside-diphosphate-sugar epimerase
MRVLVIGAAGFIGSHVVSALLERGQLAGRRIESLLLADAMPVRLPQGAQVEVRAETGDISDRAFIQHLASGVDSVFPLAATLTTEAEADFGKGLKVNLLALVDLLEALRQRRDRHGKGQAPRVVFASSIAAFGGALPDTVDDAVQHLPQTSYGTQKAIAELLINDYSRHGFIDGRALRLPIVLIRRGAPSAAVSDRVAAIVREPLLGRDTVCPFDPGTRMPVASVQRVAAALIAIHDLPASAFGDSRAMNLPALSVTAGEMVESLQRFRNVRALGRVTFSPDAQLQAVVESWPKRFVSERASRRGIGSDASFDEIIRHFLSETAA